MAWEVQAVVRFDGEPPEQEEIERLLEDWPGRATLVEWWPEEV